MNFACTYINRANSSTEIASKSVVSPAPYDPIKFTPKYRDNRPLGSATGTISKLDSLLKLNRWKTSSNIKVHR